LESLLTYLERLRFLQIKAGRALPGRINKVPPKLFSQHQPSNSNYLVLGLRLYVHRNKSAHALKANGEKLLHCAKLGDVIITVLQRSGRVLEFPIHAGFRDAWPRHRFGDSLAKHDLL